MDILKNKDQFMDYLMKSKDSFDNVDINKIIDHVGVANNVKLSNMVSYLCKIDYLERIDMNTYLITAKGKSEHKNPFMRFMCSLKPIWAYIAGIVSAVIASLISSALIK